MKKRALEVQTKYNELNERENKLWGAREYAEGLVGDVGDLMKLIQAKEGLRHKDDVDSKLQHELADCLWSIIVIANELGIELEDVFVKEMDELEQRVNRGEG